MTTMRAKFVVGSVNAHETWEDVIFRASDGAGENNSFARWTPHADLTMTISNPNLLGKFAIGDAFYADFSPAPK